MARTSPLRGIKKKVYLNMAENTFQLSVPFILAAVALPRELVCDLRWLSNQQIKNKKPMEPMILHILQSIISFSFVNVDFFHFHLVSI